MTLQKIITKVESDLKITHRRARNYVDIFHDKFNGNYRAITHLSMCCTYSGKVRMSYIISDKKYQLVIDVSKPYSTEVKKRSSPLTCGDQVVQLLGKLYPNVSPKEWEDDWVNTFEFETSGCILHIRVDELPSLDEVVAAMKSCCINMSSVGIETRSGHLTITITNFNPKTKDDINFIE